MYGHLRTRTQPTELFAPGAQLSAHSQLPARSANWLDGPCLAPCSTYLRGNSWLDLLFTRHGERQESHPAAAFVELWPWARPGGSKRLELPVEVGRAEPPRPRGHRPAVADRREGLLQRHGPTRPRLAAVSHLAEMVVPRGQGGAVGGVSLLSNMRYADDILRYSCFAAEVTRMLDMLTEELAACGLA